MNIRIAQISDLHYGNRTIEEAHRCTSFAVDAAIARAVECMVISGDSTDHALDMHAPAVAALAGNVRRVADHCPVLMLQGTFSHEPPGTLDVFRLLGGRHTVLVADRICQAALMQDGSWQVSDRWKFDQVPRGCRALFSCVPTVNKATVAAAVGAEDADWAVGEHIACLLRGFAAINETARRHGVATVGVSHGTVNGCLTEHGVPMAALDHEFTTGSLFAAGASAFMLGHIHRHQSWREGNRRIAYAGSIGRLHYGEEGAKGFVIWDVGADGAELELVETPAQKTLEVEFDGPPDLDQIKALAARADGARVRVRWQVSDEDRATVDRDAIMSALAGALEVKLEGRVLPRTQARAAGIGAAATLAEKLSRWATANGVVAAPFVTRLERMHGGPPEMVARAILAEIGSARGDLAPETHAGSLEPPQDDFRLAA